MKQKISAVVTTIGGPVAHIENLDKLSRMTGGSGLYVIGDRKTPGTWEHTRTNFFSLQNQFDSEFKTLAELMPNNHYSRKNLGYLMSVSAGDEWIYETDDDNYLKLPEGFQSFFCQPSTVTQFRQNTWVNIYNEFSPKSENDSDLSVWPRGYPLDLLHLDHQLDSMDENDFNLEGVYLFNGLVDNDPDVDAIYRLTQKLPITFSREKHMVILSNGALSPFNSQNTMWHRSLLPLMYLPITTTFRVTDILRSYIANVLIQISGKSLAFISPNAIQYRNEHNLIDDFNQEFLLYSKARELVDLIQSEATPNLSFSDNLWNIYSCLLKNDYVSSLELEAVSAWLSACGALSFGSFGQSGTSVTL